MEKCFDILDARRRYLPLDERSIVNAWANLRASIGAVIKTDPVIESSPQA